MTTEVEEVVVDADARAAQHVRPQRDERGLDGVARRGSSVTRGAIGCRAWKREPIDLAVR